MPIINGKKIASKILAELKKKIAVLPAKPGLAIILIGDDPGSHVYVSLKEEAAKEVSIYFEKYVFEATVNEQEILALIKRLNLNKAIHGIVVQFPLPRGFKKENIISAISVVKDVDGFHPENIEALLAGRPCIVPGLTRGIIQLIESTGEPLAGKKVVVMANSKIFSESLGYLLQQNGVETKACNPKEISCKNLAKEADILVVAIGQPKLITSEMIKEGAIVIDVGYNRVEGQAVGDVDFGSVKEKAGWITPVPGGVGPMTVAMLLSNVLRAYEIQKH